MNILSLGAGGCKAEEKIALDNPESSVICVDSGDDIGRNKQFIFGKDIENNPSNLALIDADYNSFDFINDISDYKGKVDLILVNFPYSDYLAYPNKNENIEANDIFISNVYNLLSDKGIAIITSERTDDFNGLYDYADMYEIHYSNVPKGMNFDFLSTVDRLAKEHGGFSSNLLNSVLKEIEIASKNIKLNMEYSKSYELFKDYFEIKSLILSKI